MTAIAKITVKLNVALQSFSPVVGATITAFQPPSPIFRAFPVETDASGVATIHVIAFDTPGTVRLHIIPPANFASETHAPASPALTTAMGSQVEAALQAAIPNRPLLDQKKVDTRLAWRAVLQKILDKKAEIDAVAAIKPRTSAETAKLSALRAELAKLEVDSRQRKAALRTARHAVNLLNRDAEKALESVPELMLRSFDITVDLDASGAAKLGTAKLVMLDSERKPDATLAPYAGLVQQGRRLDVL